MPQWLIFHGFTPPTWLTPVLSAPLVAMAWAFVLSQICDRDAVFERRLDWIRFELSRPVLLGPSIFLVTDLLDSILQVTELRLLLAVYDPSEDLEFVINLAALFGTMLRTVVLSLVAAYPIAAQALRMGKLDRALLAGDLRGNRLRLWAIFFLLNVALSLFCGLLRLRGGLVLRTIGSPNIMDVARHDDSPCYRISIRRVVDRRLGRDNRSRHEGVGIRSDIGRA